MKEENISWKHSSRLGLIFGFLALLSFFFSLLFNVVNTVTRYGPRYSLNPYFLAFSLIFFLLFLIFSLLSFFKELKKTQKDFSILFFGGIGILSMFWILLELFFIVKQNLTNDYAKHTEWFIFLSIFVLVFLFLFFIIDLIKNFKKKNVNMKVFSISSIIFIVFILLLLMSIFIF